MNKPNLFDKDNANILNAYISASSGEILNANSFSIYINCKPNTTYTISKIVSPRFTVGFTSEKPANNVVCNSFKPNDNATSITLTSNENDKYLIVYVLNSKDESTLKEILDSLKIYEGVETDDYYELPSIGDTKDILTIQNGQANINQKIGKVVLDGSENWFKSGGTTETMFVGVLDITNIIKIKRIASLNTHFSYKVNTLDIGEFYFYNNNTDGTLKNMAFGVDITKIQDLATFKTWLSNNPVTVYYELAEPQSITLNGTYDIDLFEGTNNITTNDELQPNMYCSYYTIYKGDKGEGVPTGGTKGQVLAKKSNADNDTEWVDQTGGSAYPNVYSTDEQRIGTWVDGNPLYRKTFIITSISTGSNYITHNIDNLGDLTNVYGNCLRKDGKWQPAIRTDSTLMDWQIGVNDIDSTQFVLMVGSKYTNTIVLTKGNITLEYTKTTD